MKRLSAVGLVVLALAGAAQAQTVVLVRHAEKATAPTGDPVLTPEGELRAKALAEVLAGARVTAIVTSPLQRTIRTAAPLATAAKVTPRAVGLDGGEAAHAAAVAALARATPADGTLVVVGHSNTLPSILKALGHAETASIADCRYDGLWVVRLNGDAPAVVAARYGAPSTGCGAD